MFSMFASSKRSLLAAVTAAVCLGAGAADEPPRVVQDPHYGDTLFHFFQDKWFTSITSLMVSQHFERMPKHVDEAEILRGGLLLSYGLHREASEVFAQLIERGAKPPVRDRAWFFLAKIRYQRGLLPQAEEALARIGQDLPPALNEDRQLLHAQLLMARDDFAGAATVLETLKGSATAGLYARFNLGVALVKAGDVERGSALLDEVGKGTAASEELRSLRDRANVALGFAALQDQRPENAQAVLQRVRLASLHANKALLGFGWAASELKDYRGALVPWTELAGRDMADAAVLEARIALPYALAELGAFGQSLAGYNEAIDVFERERKGLDESIAAIRAGKLLEGLVNSNPSPDMGWFASIKSLPEMPHGGHLSQVMAGHEFQEAFKNYRDLLFLTRNLDEWKDSLGVFEDMLANRRAGYAERLPKVVAKAGDTGLPALQQRRDGLAAELAQAEAGTQAEAFLNDKERELMQRLNSVRAALEKSTDPELAEAAERLRRVAGAMTWQLAEAYPARVWEAKKSLRATDAALAEAQTRDATLAQAQMDEPARHERFAARIAELTQRLQGLTPRVAALTLEQQGGAQEIAVAELQRQQERLDIYASQARLAVAQIYDRAQVAKRPGNEVQR
jgi:tetratricopeptide (TPR) repeat protein